MTVQGYGEHYPRIDPTAYVAESAVVIGDVHIGPHSSIWPTAVVRGDIQRILIGEHTNIQDGAILHVTSDTSYNPGGIPLCLGSYITVGHRVVLHACTIEDYCLIGIGSLVLDGARIHGRVMVGAGSLVPPGRELESGYLYHGSPVRQIRPLSERDISYFEFSAVHYARLKDSYRV